MATVALSSKAVGSTVKLKVNGTAKNFIVVHQGKPGSMYDASCDGTWLLMQDCYESRQWHSSNNNDYENSTIDNYLNTTFLNLFESNIRDAIKQVKIPYRKGAGYGKTVTSGSSGLSTKIFLLSSTEVNLVHGYEPTNEGACLSYFSGTAQNGADNKRVAKLNGSATYWWLRSPYCYSNYGSTGALLVLNGGGWNDDLCSVSFGIRPALVLPSSLLVSDDGSVQTNTAPTISSPSGNSGVNLGSKAAAFNFQYTPSDADGDKLTVTEKLDGVTKKTRSNVTSGTQLTFECASTAAEFQKILNGSHTITIEVSDGKEKATFTATFTKQVTGATNYAGRAAGRGGRHYGGDPDGDGRHPGRRRLHGRGHQQRQRQQPGVAGCHHGGKERHEHRVREPREHQRGRVQLPHHRGPGCLQHRRVYHRRFRRVPVRRDRPWH